LINLSYLGIISTFDVISVKEILQKNKIKFFLKNLFDTSVSAGWANPGSESFQEHLYVDKKKTAAAKKLLANYLK
jgi:hypothetical protein